ncbi:MAG: lipocalin family protein [Pyrinomonadaceae bacterium]|nr:lipocalin family protein [Pyrinomonadaceae bacterium]
MKTILFLIATLILTLSSVAFASAPQNDKNLNTVGSVDLDRYQGKWYEIARYPNRFQKKCVGNTTATYTIKKPGIVEVLNECLKENGKMNRAKGKAKVVDNETNAKLKVRFAPAWLSWLPAVWGDYWIIDLEQENYSYAVIGDPSRKYLWILSRTPELDEETYTKIIETIDQNGFESDKLIKTPQNVS